jgi:Fe2+ transport system protein FeoA/Mn-dependent DtxR family transcriptional regulator
MSTDSELQEFLELAYKFEAEKRPIDLPTIAAQLRCHVNEVDRILKTALSAGLVERSSGLLSLTEKGRLMVQAHREQYIHKKYGHGVMGRVSELFEGRVKDWRGHWRNRHGIDNRAVEDLYRGLKELKGRVEETSTLADLRQGETAIVAFALGGYGLVRRLAEMGLTPGTEVTVVRSAPLRGPVEVKVRGVSLALGRGVASKIIVKGLERDAASGA